MEQRQTKKGFGRLERSDVLAMRVGLLGIQERAMAEMVFGDGYRTAQIARVMGLHPWNVKRRIGKIVRRLAGGEYLACLRNRERFTEIELAVVRDHFFRGRNLAEIAVKMGLTRYGVRQILLRVEAKRRCLMEDQK